MSDINNLINFNKSRAGIFWTIMLIVGNPENQKLGKVGRKVAEF